MEEEHTEAGGQQGGQAESAGSAGCCSRGRQPTPARVVSSVCLHLIVGSALAVGRSGPDPVLRVVHWRRRNLMPRTSRAFRGRWDMLVGQSLRRHRALSAMFGWLLASVKCSVLIVRVRADTWAPPPQSGIRAHCTLTPSCSTSPSLCRFLRQDPPLPQPADGLCSLRRCWRRRCPLGHPSQR